VIVQGENPAEKKYIFFLIEQNPQNILCSLKEA